MSSHESATDALLCEPAGPVGSAQATVRLGCLRFVPSAHPIMRFALRYPIDMLSGQALFRLLRRVTEAPHRHRSPGAHKGRPYKTTVNDGVVKSPESGPVSYTNQDSPFILTSLP